MSGGHAGNPPRLHLADSVTWSDVCGSYRLRRISGAEDLTGAVDLVPFRACTHGAGPGRPG